MLRSSLGGCVAVLASAVLISACSNDSRNSTEPVAPPVSESIVPAGCPTVGQTASTITALFPKGSSRTNAAQMYATIVIYINSGRLADARTLMFQLLDFTLQQYNAGKLIGGYLPTTQKLLLQFETGLYCTVGVSATGLTLPGDPSTRGTVDQVVYPSTTTQNIVTPNGKAAVQIPGGSTTGPVLVTITPTSDTLNTSLDKYGPFSDVKVSPEASIQESLSVGICLDDGAQIPTVYLAHNNSPTTIEVLPRGNFISGLCGVTVPPTSMRKVYDLGKNGDFASAAELVGSAVANMFLPTNANATGGGITGTTKKFSPFGGVDTKIFPYGSSYQFSVGAHDFDPGFEASAFPATDFTEGSGPFGSGDNTTVCPLNSEIGFTLNHAWTLDTDLLLRKTFSLPTGWNGSLTVSAAIDNDVAVYVNGTAVTQNFAFTGSDSSNYSYSSTSGFVTHENCATKGSLSFTVPASLLHAGGNLVAIRARDRGGVNYVDAAVSVTVPQ
jgi:hypothetical protein